MKRTAQQDGANSDAQSLISEGPSEPDLNPDTLGDKPVINKGIYKVIQDLRSTIHKDFQQITSSIHKDHADLGERTNHLEHKTEELCTAHNDVADRIQRLEEEHVMMKNNVRFRGIADSITADQLLAYISTMCQVLVLELQDTEYI
ncbi:Hypothetical predicted protein, partial [Pelobates cultripes]